MLSTAEIAQEQLIPAFQRSTNCNVLGIASGSGLSKAKEVAEKFNIDHTYDSYDALLDDKTMDAVYIPLPNHLHKKWVIEAAKRGKHVLCEKPAALTADDIVEMKQVCEQHKVIFMEAFMYQFHPQHNRVREIISTGEIGEVKFMRSSFSFLVDNCEENIRMNLQKGGGVLFDLGCYSIHSIRNILSKEPISVAVHGVINQEYKVDTDACAHLKFANGITAVFDISFRLVDRNEYEVVGTEGRILVSDAYRPDLVAGEAEVIVEKKGVKRVETISGDQYRMQVEHISDAIIKGAEKVGNDFDNTINNMRVIDACYKSINSNQEVKLN